MSWVRRLLTVGGLADSMGVYVPAVVFQKALGLLRMLLFAYLLADARAELGLWWVAVMVFSLAAPLMTLGTSNGLRRYVAFYETRGMLREFYRRVRVGVAVCAAAMLAAGLLASPALTRLLRGAHAGAAGAGHDRLLALCAAALANAFLLTLYLNMVGFMAGLRVYRLLAAVEVLFGVVFVVLGGAALTASASSLMILAAHFASLAVSLAAGMALLHVGIAQRSRGAAAGFGPEEAPAPLGRPGPLREPSEPHTARVFGRIVRFGIVAMAANLLWLAAEYVSFYAVYRGPGDQGEAGIFGVFLRLAEPMLFLASAAWAVLLVHVVKRWESRRRRTAVGVLEASYKAVALAVMTLTMIVYAAAPLWVHVLPRSFRHGLPVLGGLLMFFEASAHAAVLTIVAKLHERPWAIALAAAAGGAANAVLAWLWMPRFAYAPEGAAWAAGVGMYAGSCAVAAAYFLLARVRLGAATWAVLLAPGLLAAGMALPGWAVAVIWGLLAATGLASRTLFTPRERWLVLASLGRVRRLAGRIVGRR